MKKLIIILTVVTISLAGCLKDNPNVDFSKIVPTINLPYSGLAYFSSDAVTDAGDTITKTFTINLASDYPLKTDTKVTVGVDNTVIPTYDAAYPAVNFIAMPAGAYVFPQTTVTIKAGTRLATLSVTFYKHVLDPSQSYLLPIKILSADQVISANFSIHYYHFIGNDFAGSYKYDYRRWQNGTGAGAPNITSLGQLPPADGTTLSPVTPTEFKMITDYNGQKVQYDVTFTRTVTSPGVVTYTNWAVKFLPEDLAKWAPAGISNIQAPAFTVPPPANNSAPKVFELNYISGGAFPRYIDDTYTKL